MIWREDGLIVTNDHVVPREQAEVVLADGRTLAATVRERDSGHDLAVLRVEASGLPAAAIGDSQRLRPGQVVLAMGNPLGRRGAATVGVVSSAELRMRSGRGRGRARESTRSLDSSEFIRAYVQLAPGNSGGPLVDVEGRVLGINSRVSGPRLALAIPSHVVERFLAAGGSQVQMGIGGTEVELPPAWRERLGLAEATAIMATHVVEGGMAESSGLLLGDIIVALDGQSVDTVAAMADRLAARDPGPELRVRVIRGGELVDLAMQPVPPARRARTGVTTV